MDNVWMTSYKDYGIADDIDSEFDAALRRLVTRTSTKNTPVLHGGGPYLGPAVTSTQCDPQITEPHCYSFLCEFHQRASLIASDTTA